MVAYGRLWLRLSDWLRLLLDDLLLDQKRRLLVTVASDSPLQ